MRRPTLSLRLHLILGMLGITAFAALLFSGLTLLFAYSVEDALFEQELIRLAATLGVDAFIVQDIGMVQLCREIAPNVAVHASTQMSIHSLEGVVAAAELGCSRVVLSREALRLVGKRWLQRRRDGATHIVG